MPILVVFLLLSQNLALGKQWPWSALPGDLGRLLWVVLTLAFLCIVLSERLRQKASARLSCVFATDWAWKALVLLQGPFLLYSYWHFRVLGYGFPWPQLVLVAVTATFIQRDRLGLALLFSLGLQLGAIFTFPLNPARSDMLPVIQAALTNWSHGLSPYSAVSLPAVGIDHMPYLPGTFFSHWPAWALGVDLRWGQLFYRAIWMGILYRALRTSDLVQLFALSPYLGCRHDLYFEIFLLLIVLYWRYPRARCWSIPALVVTRQWAWVLAPFAVIDWLQKGRFVRRAALLAVASASFVIAFVWLLRSTTDLALFRSSISVFDQWIEHPTFTDDYGLTLAPLFYRLHSAQALVPLQALVCIAYFAYGTFYRRKSLMICAASCWIVFITLNPHFWNYFWLSPTLWAVLTQTELRPTIQMPIA